MKKYIAVVFAIIGSLLLSACAASEDVTVTQLTRVQSVNELEQQTAPTVNPDQPAAQLQQSSQPTKPEIDVTEAVSETTPLPSHQEVTIVTDPHPAQSGASAPTETTVPEMREVTAVLTPVKPTVPETTEPEPVPSEPTEPTPTEPAPTEPAPTEPAPTEPAPTEPAPTEPVPTEPAPTEPAPTEPDSTPAEQVCELPWGIRLSARNVTPVGLEILCTNISMEERNSLETGRYYVIQCWTGAGWQEAPRLPGNEELCWPMDALGCSFSDGTVMEASWEYIYGELPAGQYRIGKEFHDPSGESGDWKIYYLEFTVA